MKTYNRFAVVAYLAAIFSIVGSDVSFAQVEPEPTPSEGAVAEDAAPETLAPEPGREKPARYGLGLRLRAVVLPQFLATQIFEDTPSSKFNIGYGLDFVRINDGFEIRIGFEYEKLSYKNGYWLEKGDDAVSDGEAPDLVEFDGTAWITLDSTFIFHARFAEWMAFRYGAGIGVGYFLGDVVTTDAVCTSRDIQNDCEPRGNATPNIEELPSRIWPVVNLLAGFQFNPHPDVAINLEGGLRSVPFFGMSASYTFF